MFRKLLATAGALSALVAGPGFASPCTDQIDALERRLNDTALVDAIAREIERFAAQRESA